VKLTVNDSKEGKGFLLEPAGWGLQGRRRGEEGTGITGRSRAY
jgi:hypothetical protein